ncbi:MAG: DHH family phosphoesterase [Candidatus Omnitrophica bacterium]|nr:DHH family phosphoesterase [Candidatus Omnitrophota bacterium]
MENSKRLLKFLEKNARELSPLLILTHDYPDPDAIASAFALKYLAERYYGIDSRIVYGGFISTVQNRQMVRLLHIPINKVTGADLRKYQNIALVDTQPGFGNNSFPRGKKAAIVLDQHSPVDSRSSKFAIVDTGLSATCEILAEALLSLGKPIPPLLATALVFGIITDTYDLYRARKKNVLKLYLLLLMFCDMKRLIHLKNPPRTRNFFAMIKKGMEKAAVHGKLIRADLGHVQDPVYVAHIADFLLTYEKAVWALCTGRHKGKLYVSLRAASLKGQAQKVLKDVIEDKSRAGGHGAIAGGSEEVGVGAPENLWAKHEHELTARLLSRLKIENCKKTAPFLPDACIMRGKL